MRTRCPLLPLTDLQTATLPLARDPTNGPSTPVPLFRPLEAKSGIGLLPPPDRLMTGAEIFHKFGPRKIRTNSYLPREMGPRAKISN